jgi:hypothetical protein
MPRDLLAWRRKARHHHFLQQLLHLKELIITILAFIKVDFLKIY